MSIKATTYDLLRASPHVGRGRPPDVKGQEPRDQQKKTGGRECEEGTTPRRGPPPSLLGARSPCVARVWQKIAEEGEEGEAALGLPGRTARSRPTDSTCSISSRRHPRSRWTLLDGRPPCRPAETRDFSGAMITMTPRYMHASTTRDKAI